MSCNLRPFVFILGILICVYPAWGANTDVLINEIHYSPDSDLQNEEFIELFNRGSDPVDIGGWAFTKGVTFQFPAGTSLNAGAYLVLARNRTTLISMAPNAQVVGDYSGKLSDSGETLALYDAQGILIDAVKYQDSPPWPTSPDGEGPSLERISPLESSNDSYSWSGAAASRGTTKNWLMSPGVQNSVFALNFPPRIQQVTYTPEYPKPLMNVTVQALIEDTDGIEVVELYYQPVNLNNSSQPVRSILMEKREGVNEEGIWTAVIPGQSDRTLVRFWIQAADRAGMERRYPAPTEARHTLTYFHYADEAESMIPIVFLYDFGSADQENDFRGDSAFVVRYPDQQGWEVYDHILTTRRQRFGDGYDIYFLKHYEFEDMSSINVVFEQKPRYALSEWLSYQIYYALGVIAGKTDHYRFIRNDRDYGYYLMFEQPNKHFISRNGLNNEGNSYKIRWSFDRNTSVSQILKLHDKRTNKSLGYDDIIEIVQTLHQLSDREQALYIESNINVDQFINYFTGCQLISDWDGYFNNHFVYHDTEGSGLWYVFPWDKDKTWGDSDAYRNILPYYDFYDFPILFGAYGTPQSGKDNNTWWRPPGYFSGTMLANMDIQAIYLNRLAYAVKNIFTPDRWFPVIDALEKRLEPEVRHRAEILGSNVNSTLSEFQTDIESFRRQVLNRREFILQELEKVIGPVGVHSWMMY